jgi:hypothetical protein
MKKIHYTIYNGNYEKGQDACPMCNDQKQYPYQYLTTDIDEVTCKKCLKSKIKSANFALEMIPHMLKPYQHEESVNRLKKEKEMIEERLKYLEGEQS